MAKRFLYQCSIQFCFLFIFSLGGIAGAAAACNSGPDYCSDDPRIPAALAEKKQRLAQEYPARLVQLIDRGVQCVARIKRSPDAFTILAVRPNGDSETLLWGQDNEDAGKKEIAAGGLKHFWIVNARNAFECDGEKPYNERPDYNAADDVNTSLAIKCTASGCDG